MKKLFSVLAGTLLTCSMYAQNLVENGGFEELDKKPKALGMIHQATSWYSPTTAFADLHLKYGKTDLNKVPVNKFGKEDAKVGDNYAGLRLYSYQDREPRTYLSTKLSAPLEKGEWYCIRFHVSLSDLSKYAINNIGIYVSEDSIYRDGNENLFYEPQIIHSTNRVFDQMWSWEAICRIYVAKGGEQYITIGNFAPQLEVTALKMKRPREYTTTQFRSAYYYIDDISVTPGGTRLNCKCEKGNYAFAHLEKEEKNFGSDPDNMPETEFINSTGRGNAAPKAAKPVRETLIVPFALAKAAVSGESAKSLDEAAAFLKANKDVKVNVIGHIDRTEVRLPGVAEKRMNAVRKYLLSKGVPSGQIMTENVGETKPLDDSGLKENRHKNTVVELVYKK